MKKIAKLSVAVLCISAVTSLAFAAKPGAYIGAGLGDSMMEKQNNTYNNHNNGLGGRLFAGYNFNEYFGLEAGLARYAQAKSNFAINQNTPNNFVNLTGSTKTNLTAFDVVGKAYLPIQDSGFNLYGLAGLAYAHETVDSNTAVQSRNGSTAFSSYSYKQNSVHPIYGVGASYNIPQSNFVTNVEFTRLQGSTSIMGGKKAANANMLTLNVAYNFD